MWTLFELAVTEDIFKIGSTAPGAMLYDALDHFEVWLFFFIVDIGLDLLQAFS